MGLKELPLVLPGIFLVFLTLVCSDDVGAKDEPSVPDFDQIDVGKDLMTHSSLYFLENFNDKDMFSKSWIKSKAKKKTDDGSSLQYDGDWILEKSVKESLPNDLGLTFLDRAKHRAVSAKLFRKFNFSNRPLVIQYEVLHQDGQECGGAYLKLISEERKVKDLGEFNDKTPYTIMFGPDKCGSSSKLHFIFQHKNPLNGSFEEKHCKPAKTRIDETFTDSKPHLFKLVVNPDNSFTVTVDHAIINEGSLLDSFDPPVNPPKEIDDPSDRKPENWDDRARIPDPNAKKPEDWDETAPAQISDPNAEKPSDWLEDEPINISDPSAEKPDDWDEEMDGEWEAPLVPNPACEDASGCGPWSPPLIPNPVYKGIWSAPLIDNPNFKGVWKPRRIPNPDFFEDKHPYRMMTIDAVGFEIWSVSARIMFDNLIITDDENVARQFASVTFDKKLSNIEKSAETLLNQFVAFTNRYPWLWAVYVVVLLIPVTLIVVCCFWSGKESEATLAARRKRDDDLLSEDSLLDENLAQDSSAPSGGDSAGPSSPDNKPEESDDEIIYNDEVPSEPGAGTTGSSSSKLEESDDDDEQAKVDVHESNNKERESEKEDDGDEETTKQSAPDSVLKKRK